MKTEFISLVLVQIFGKATPRGEQMCKFFFCLFVCLFFPSQKNAYDGEMGRDPEKGESLQTVMQD